MAKPMKVPPLARQATSMSPVAMALPAPATTLKPKAARESLLASIAQRLTNS
eukprot:CAMPEP_0175301648 /NCGR_PEP_ID=MMETSP0093-20121207/61749_1 /TAXON_ID=311494 /ORGANISM="Alexandrium monilatum, Strain CCMP3105" /LENGTH=51 /DNA_ID=CAMNT_0016597875 /DNA_START=83 /DNA_END=234 /DNA_ORIENTATION=+